MSHLTHFKSFIVSVFSSSRYERNGVISIDNACYLQLAMAKDPEASFFKRLEGLQPCEVSELKPGTHIFAVYGVHFSPCFLYFSYISMYLQVCCIYCGPFHFVV